MKALLLNAWDKDGGAARAAFRLMKGLQQEGIDASMLVKKKNLPDPAVIGPGTRIDRIMAYVRPILENYRIKRYPAWNGMTFSPSLFPDRLRSQISALNPDIVHLHWVGDGFLKIETLPRLQQPLIWTLHDSWPFTGGCHIPFNCTGYRRSCGTCPVLGSSRENDLSRSVWQRKQKSWHALDLTIVSPSRWLGDCAKASQLFHGRRIEIIPNGLDLLQYRPVDMHCARAALSLPQDKKIILFGGMHSTRDRNKGFAFLRAAIAEMAAKGWGRSTELLVLGSSGPPECPEIEINTRYLGWLHDDISLALAYAAADVFVVPSIQENLPNTIMEAMACGTPCVAFSQGGIPDMIEHQTTGFLAEPADSGNLAHGIMWVLEDGVRRQALSRNARQKAERDFSLETTAKRYAALYEELLGARH